MLPRLALTFALAVVVSPREAVAQTPPSSSFQPAVQTQQYDAPAYIAVVDGTATLERDGRIEDAPLNMPLLSGDRIRTAEGRVEIRFADGGRLHLDARTSLDVLSDELVRLGEGRLRLSIQRAQQVTYRVDSSVGSVRITQAGEYRIGLVTASEDTQLELAVIRGAGEVFTDRGATPVRSGERAYASAGLVPSYAYAYNSANLDDFDRWSEMQRGTVYAASSDSAQYLPAEMTTYASTFDQYGDWRYEQAYGRVWYPRVATGWRPYYYGRWATYPAYGNTWIAADPFGYPTHHYGRWGFSANAWFWIPSASWGPAYVSWAYAPSYVSWCPLGWNNAAVFSIGYYNAGPAYYRGHGHYYSAWTTVPHGYFGRGYYANRYAVNWDRPGHGSGARPHFSEGRPTPVGRDAGFSRNAAPVRFTGTRAASADRGFADGRSRPTGFASAPARDVVSRASGGSGIAADTARRAGATETPRFINRGDQIVRSQSERPTPPARDVVRTAPQGFTRDTRAPGVNDGRTPDARDGRAPDVSVSRAAPSGGTPGYGAYDRAMSRPQPRVQQPQPETRTYASPSASAGVYDRPTAGIRTYERQPTVDRAYERPSVSDRAYERPNAVRDSPRPMERSMPPPSTERQAPPQRAPQPSGGGGDRAVPRGGGGGGGTPAAPHVESRASAGGSIAGATSGRQAVSVDG